MNKSDEKIAIDLEPLLLELGKAVYVCQTFESSLYFLHALMTLEETKEKEGALTAAWDFYSTKTLGQTINALRKRIEIPADIDNFLEEGIKFRNQIVHSFMTNNALKLLEPKGRLEAKMELEALKMEVKHRDIVVNKFLDALFAKYGISNESLKRQAGALYVGENRSSTGDSKSGRPG